MIDEEPPRTWRDLEDATARILREAGFTVDVEVELPSPRGNNVVDVLAIDHANGRDYTILCECKDWRRPVDKGIVHAFKDVVHETGAHVGYLISTNGFQSGALRAADATNLELVTWAEFQLEFEPQWLESHLLPTVADRLGALFAYVEPFNNAVDRAYGRLEPAARASFDMLKARYTAFGLTAWTLTPHLGTSRTVPELPLPQPAAARGHEFPPQFFETTSWRPMLDAILEFGERAITEMSAVLHPDPRSHVGGRP